VGAACTGWLSAVSVASAQIEARRADTVPESAMVLTGKQALEYSGGVSAEDNLGIGGYERIMGPNGQAQYWAPDIASACRQLLSYYEHSYVAPGERFPGAQQRPTRSTAMCVSSRTRRLAPI
jgi:hypothetical protein